MTAVAQRRAKAAGIELFTVGVGLGFNDPNAQNELRLIASDPKCIHMHLAADFDKLALGTVPFYHVCKIFIAPF